MYLIGKNIIMPKLLLFYAITKPKTTMCFVFNYRTKAL